MYKPTHQPKAGVHGQKNESGFGLSSLIQFGKNTVKAKAAFGVFVAALNGISFTGVCVYLAINFCVCQCRIRPAYRCNTG